MPDIKITDFGGRLPRRSKRLLPANFAQEAVNVKLLSGELRGLHALSLAHEFPDATNPAMAWRVLSSAIPQTEAWAYSLDPKASLLKSPLITDAFDRWYLFEENQPPKITTFTDIDNGTGPYDLAFDAPTTAPTVVPDTPGQDTRVYVYTYVTSWGEETVASPPTTVNATEGNTVTISNFYTPAPSIAGRSYDLVRIYRTVTGESSTSLFFVAEIAWGVTSYADSESSAIVSLNEIFSTDANEQVPDGVYGARVHPSGALVAFKGRDIYFSRPYLPHAWPSVWKLSVEDEIVGIEIFEQNIAVMTKGRPALLFGPTPGQIGILRFPAPEPCISYGSIVGAPEGAYYASHQGLVLFTAVGPKNITRELISKEEWETDYLSPDLSATRFGTQYMAVEANDVGFVIDTLEARIALTDLVGTQQFTAFTEDIYTGDVYLIGGDEVFLWDDYTAPEIDYIWKSKQVVLPKPVNHGAVMVHLEPRDTEYFPPAPLPTPPYPAEYAAIDKLNTVLVEVWNNDERIFVGACGDREQVRLPSGKKGDAWELRITGQCRVYSVSLTETGKGMGRV